LAVAGFCKYAGFTEQSSSKVLPTSHPEGQRDAIALSLESAFYKRIIIASSLNVSKSPQ
jgi:hypothetical protein